MTRRARGFTLVEVLISLALAAIMSTFLLMLTRGQLSAYALNDQLTKAQQNGRAGMDFLEALLRKACGGIANGRLNIAGSAGVRYCVQVFDGANESSGTFSGGAATSQADAIEIVYGTAPFTVAKNTATASVDVWDITGFAAGDLVLVTNHKEAILYKLASVVAGGTAPQGTLNFTTTGTPPPGLVLASGNAVMAAQSVSVFQRTTNNDAMLFVDPDGMCGTTHADAEPLVEGVDDFQIAVGLDSNDNGRIETVPDEWLGNGTSEFPLLNTVPWNVLPSPPGSASTPPQYRQIRVSLLARTSTAYAGASTVTTFENRTTYPTVGGFAPRFRPMRMVVAPRAWNLLN